MIYIGPLDVETSKRVSLQKQLINRLKQAILSGRMPAGSRLVPSRLLATELGVSRNTVMLAYEHLMAEGYVTANRQGSWVNSLIIPAEHSNKPPKIDSTPVLMAHRLQSFKEIHSQPVSHTALLAPGIPSLKDFPLAAWRRSLERAIKQTGTSSLAYKEAPGEPSLRQAIAMHLHIARGVRCDASQVIITEGARHALELCVTLMTNAGDSVWIENPGYQGARSVFKANDLRIVPIPVDNAGLAIPVKAWHKHSPKLIYTSPAHQYPTGAVLSVSRRMELITRAKESGTWIIEDDYDGDFRHVGEPIASMQGLTEDAPVFYLGSFSKTMFPTLRIGFLVLPKNVMLEAQSVLPELLQGGNQLQQLALSDFITSGEFGRHLGRMRRLYRERRHVLNEALATHFPQEQILGGSAGMHLTLKLPAGLDDMKIAKMARSKGIGVHALSAFFIKPTHCDTGLIIGYGNTTADNIPRAVNIIAQLLGACSK